MELQSGQVAMQPSDSGKAGAAWLLPPPWRWIWNLTTGVNSLLRDFIPSEKGPWDWDLPHLAA